MDESSDVLFHEVQRFRQRWLWAILVGTFVLTAGAVLLAFRADPPAPGERGSAFGTVAATLLVHGGLLALFAYTNLDVTVRRDGIHFRFWPFHRRERFIPLEQIVRHEARDYSPIGDYGGWGIRGFASDRAYNVSGRRGVQLVLGDGRRVLFGSQRADELDAAITRAAALR